MATLINKIYYYLLTANCKTFWTNIARWFSYYKIVRKIDDIDSESVLKLEQYQLSRIMRSSLSERDKERINLAIKLIDIILDVDDLLEYNQGEWIINKYINTKNLSRYMDDGNINAVIKWDLRQRKAWHLYHKLRLYYMQSWWV